MNLDNLRKDIRKYSSKQKAEFLAKYFKTGVGEYAEGDIFLGLTVPLSRKIAHTFKDLAINEIQTLLNSKIHEERQIALMILSLKTKGADDQELEKLHKFYLLNLKNVNNWDLVDGSAENLVGKIILRNPNHTVIFKGRSLQASQLLQFLSRSENVWERRIAIIATFEFIKNTKFKETLKISKLLLNDQHDLIHKAVGWMLREVGKRNQKVEEGFLKKYYKKMPRTMLRYAIERFPESLRLKYLRGEI